MFSSLGFWYFDHFSCVIFLTCFFFRLAHLALQNVNKDYIIFLYFRNFFAKSDQKPKTKNGMNETIISYFQSFIGYWWPPGWFFKKQTFAQTRGKKDCIMQWLELSTVSVSLISKKADQDTVPHFFILSLFLKTWLFWEHFIGWNKMYMTPKINSATSWWLQLLQ